MLKAIDPALLAWARSEEIFCSQSLFIKSISLLPVMKTSETEVLRKKISQLIQKWKKAGLIAKTNEFGYPAWRII